MNLTLILKYLLFLLMAFVSAALNPYLLAEEHKPAHAFATEPRDVVLPPYVQRGNDVTSRYPSYTARLSKLYEAMRALLSQEAPDLAKKLKSPEPVAYGYQIVPHIVPDKPLTKPLRVTSRACSWGRTEKLIYTELAKLAGLEEKLQQLSKHPVAARRPKYEKMIAKYTRLEANQRLIDSHIRYNRFWQKAIAGEKARFDRLTRLHDDVLERQEIRDKLKKAPPADITIELRAREQALTDQITAQRDHGTPAPFLMVRQPHPNLWIVQVPLYTDIQDQKFLQEGKEAIERVWHIKDGDKEYRVQVLVKIVDPQDLYRPGLPPRVGAHIDVGAHVKHFPTDGGVLTTGANSTFAIPGRYVALPPQKIAKNVLAHEFGHILGLKDGYFRGYRNLGELGYEVLEIVLDPGDIMSAPGYGKVLPAHFDKLIAAQPGKALAGPPHSP